MAHPIAESARGWLGTRFSHQGRVKRTDTHGGGVDCLGLLVCVARELKLAGRTGKWLADCDRKDYSRRPETQTLRYELDNQLTPINTENVAEGDVLLLSVDGSAQHLGIVGFQHGRLTVIHAYAQARRVVEQTLDSHWRGQIAAAYRITAG